MVQIVLSMSTADALLLTFIGYIYEHPRPLPSLRSSFIEWEQCVFEGHATHPVTIVACRVEFITY